ncbi:MAG TPA: RNA-binding S4 domain-containing protein [Abditibacteriaceae bacterium]|jgi:ribosomal 50S subunit-recycling heat shock protein
MRLDAFLKQTGLIKRRPVAKAMCDGGKIARNGKVSKASDEVRAGDTLRISFGTRNVDVKIIMVPTGNVAKAARDDYFQITGEEQLADDFDF